MEILSYKFGLSPRKEHKCISGWTIGDLYLPIGFVGGIIMSRVGFDLNHAGARFDLSEAKLELTKVTLKMFKFNLFERIQAQIEF